MTLATQHQEGPQRVVFVVKDMTAETAVACDTTTRWLMADG
jgi:hypothetical protein